VIKYSRHLRTLQKCRKHEPQARVFYISLVFSNAQSVLAQCNTRLSSLIYKFLSFAAYIILGIFLRLTNVLYILKFILDTTMQRQSPLKTAGHFSWLHQYLNHDQKNEFGFITTFPILRYIKYALAAKW